MKTTLRNILFKSHFIALGLAIVNILFKHISTYSLHSKIETSIELYVFSSGLILFFFHLRPFKNINVYFLIYNISAFLIAVGLIVKGFFGAIVLSMALFAFFPEEVKFKEKGIVIASSFNGIMGRNNTFHIKERRFVIFEKKHGIWENEDENPIDFEKVKIHASDFEIDISYSFKYNDEVLHKIIPKNTKFFTFE